ncbi:hypothetical protein [Enterovirga sp. CN4-39]|uniref:hypothetical protein n=1 Tax=Enterovirga sp. CN4-39 TaxID=3400910 RepID=UPI003BFB8195
MASREEILTHRNFAHARDCHIAGLVDLFAGDRFVTRMMSDAAVISMRALVVGFHASYSRDDRSTWATPRNLRELIVERSLASPRRMDDMIARFRQARYVEVAPSPMDRRVRVFTPTERLLQHDHDHLAAYHRFLLELFPGEGYEWTIRGCRDTQLAIRRTAFRRLPQAMAFMRHAPMMMFLARDAGYLAFLLLAHAQLEGRERDLSFSRMSADLGVSRTHIRNLFEEAEAAGLVRLSPGKKRPAEITPQLWEAYDSFLADVQADQHAIARVAFGRAS